MTTGRPSAVTVQPKAAHIQATHSQDHSTIVAMETDKLRKEYESKLAEMKESYEAELMSKQKLQEEMERLKNDYNKKVHNVEEQYAGGGGGGDSVGVGMGALPADSAISMIALANDAVSLKKVIQNTLEFYSFTALAVIGDKTSSIFRLPFLSLLTKNDASAECLISVNSCEQSGRVFVWFTGSHFQSLSSNTIQPLFKYLACSRLSDSGEDADSTFLGTCVRMADDSLRARRAKGCFVLGFR